MSETIHEQDASELYKEDMVKYLIIVNRRRAFPEIIDGFKPVQRKVIFDMYMQGANSFKDRIKMFSGGYKALTTRENYRDLSKSLRPQKKVKYQMK